MLDYAHDHDGVVFVRGLVSQEVAIDDRPVMPQLGGAALEIRLRFLGDGEAGALDPALRGIDEPRAPSWTDLEDTVSRLQAELLEAIVELPDGRGAQCVLRSAVDALRVHRMVAI